MHLTAHKHTERAAFKQTAQLLQTSTMVYSWESVAGLVVVVAAAVYYATTSPSKPEKQKSIVLPGTLKPQGRLELLHKDVGDMTESLRDFSRIFTPTNQHLLYMTPKIATGNQGALLLSKARGSASLPGLFFR